MLNESTVDGHIVFVSGYSGISGCTTIDVHDGVNYNMPSYSRSGYFHESHFISFSGYNADAPVADVNPPLKKGYYEKHEEDAVVRFILATDEVEKRNIYNNDLRVPINKMIESIIRTYRLYRKEFNFVDLHADALSFLMTKFDKFDPTMGKKSFSYFGTICRHYLYGEMIKAYKKSTRTADYDEVVNDLMLRPDMIMYIDQEELDMNKFIGKLISEIEVELAGDKITDNEYKIGVSLIQILNDWHILFEDFVGTPKFNKNLILLWLREMTGLSTKEIRNAMKRFKSLYYLFKDKYIT